MGGFTTDLGGEKESWFKLVVDAFDENIEKIENSDEVKEILEAAYEKTKVGFEQFCKDCSCDFAVSCPVDLYYTIYYCSNNDILTFCEETLLTSAKQRLSFNFKNISSIPLLFPLTSRPVERTFSFWRRMMDRNPNTTPFVVFCLLFCQQFSLEYILIALETISYNPEFCKYMKSEYKSKIRDCENLHKEVIQTHSYYQLEFKKMLFNYLKKALKINNSENNNGQWTKCCSIQFFGAFSISVPKQCTAKTLEQLIIKLVWVGFIHYEKPTTFIEEFSVLLQDEEA